jgi:hypothetical protein
VRDRKRQESLRSFVDLGDRVGFQLEPFQKKIAGALLGPEREKLITLPPRNGKSRLIGTFAAWHLLTTQVPRPTSPRTPRSRRGSCSSTPGTSRCTRLSTRSSRSASGNYVAPMVASFGYGRRTRPSCSG